MKTLILSLLVTCLLAMTARANDMDIAIRDIQSGNCKSGVGLLEKIAGTGDAKAEYNLGYSYRNGVCVGQNDKTAFKWYAAAAQHGLSEAQDQIGWMLANGIGVKRDLRQSVIWSDAAARQGNRHAKENLAAAAYELGWSHLGGVGGYPQDMFKAYLWFSVAKKNGHRDTDTYLDVTGNGPDAARIKADADRVIRTCITSHYRDCG